MPIDLIRPFVRYVTNPLYVRRDGYRYTSLIRHLERTQWMSPNELADMQLQTLRSHLDFVYRNNLFHRSRMDAVGIVPSDVAKLTDLQQLPILQKSDIRLAGDGLFSHGYTSTNTIHTRTGGSTGVPLQVYIDRPAMNWKYAATWRHNHWAGWRAGDRVAAIWGNTTRAFSIKSWLRNQLQHRMIFLDTLSFSEASCAAFLERIQSFKPTLLFGHAHSVYLFARYCEERDIRLRGLSAVITTAMTLSDSERSTIQCATQAPIFNRYGCEEISIIASESESHAGLHVFSEGLILELLPTDGSSENEILVTDLLNRAMPLLRYSIGDVARPTNAPCPSGRGLQRLERVSGRTSDFLYRPDGTMVFGISLLDTYIIHIPGIRQAQIVQNDIRELEVRIVPSNDFSNATTHSVVKILSQEFGQSVRIRVTCVERLAQTERGKYQFSICNIVRPVRS